MPTGLTTQERRWVELVAEGESDAKAYEQAYGCSPASAKTNAHRLRKRPRVRSALFEERQRTIARAQVRRDDLVELLWIWSSFDPLKLFDDSGSIKSLSSIPPELRRCITSVETTAHGIKVRTVNRERAADILRRMIADPLEELMSNIDLGVFSDAQLAEIKDGKPVIEVVLEAAQALRDASE